MDERTTQQVAQGTRIANDAVEASRRAALELVELWLETVRLGARVSADVGRHAMDMAREAQAAALRAQAAWPDTFRDPVAWYERSVRDAMEMTRRAFDLAGSGSKAFAQYAERLATSTEGSLQRVQGALADVPLEAAGTARPRTWGASTGPSPVSS
jgi:hypothetical protein